MKEVITFAIQKGGTGKTSNAVSIAVELAQKEQKVLIIDADPQGNATTWLTTEDIEHELADVLMKKCKATDAVMKTQVEGMELIPTASLGSSLRLYSKTLANESPFAFRHIIKEIKDNYDYIIIDTSPAFGALEVSCLLASDEAITVLSIDEFSSDGLITFLDNIENMQDKYDCEKPKIQRIILNARDLRLVQQSDYIRKLTAATPAQVYIVPVDQSFKKAQAVHVPIQFLDGTKKETLAIFKEIAKSITED